MSDVMTVTDAKARLSELVAAVATTQDHIDITRNGQPAAVLISHAELTALRETIAILSDPAAVEDIKEAQADVLAGRTVNADADDLREAMRARRHPTE
jgi:antitoxin YefM